MSRRARSLVRFPGSGDAELIRTREQPAYRDTPGHRSFWLKAALKLAGLSAALGGAYLLGWSSVEPAQGTMHGTAPQALQRDDMAAMPPPTSIATVVAPAANNAAPPVSATPPALSRHLANDEIREIQIKLQAMGHDPGPIDGFHGPQTVSAVKRYEIAMGLEPTGNIDLRLLKRLRSEP